MTKVSPILICSVRALSEGSGLLRDAMLKKNLWLGYGYELGMFGTNLFCDNDSFPALVVSRLRLSIWLKLGNNLRNFSW